MKQLFRLVLAAALVPLGIRAVGAQATSLTVSGNPGLLRISAAVAGGQPVSVTNATTSYTMSTPLNPKNRVYKITAELDAAMPVGTTLEATFAPPPGATSYGAVALDVTARDVVTNIANDLTSTRGITYRFSATAAAGVIPVTSRTVTITITRGP